MNYSRCSICNEQGHNQSKCPDLCDPLKPGFHSGGGGGGGGNAGDDDDERASMESLLCLELGLTTALELLQCSATTLEHGFSTDSDSPLLLRRATTSLNRFTNLLDTTAKTRTL